MLKTWPPASFSFMASSWYSMFTPRCLRTSTLALAPAARSATSFKIRANAPGLDPRALFIPCEAARASNARKSDGMLSYRPASRRFQTSPPTPPADASSPRVRPSVLICWAIAASVPAMLCWAISSPTWSPRVWTSWMAACCAGRFSAIRRAFTLRNCGLDATTETPNRPPPPKGSWTTVARSASSAAWSLMSCTALAVVACLCPEYPPCRDANGATAAAVSSDGSTETALDAVRASAVDAPVGSALASHGAALVRMGATGCAAAYLVLAGAVGAGAGAVGAGAGAGAATGAGVGAATGAGAVGAGAGAGAAARAGAGAVGAGASRVAVSRAFAARLRKAARRAISCLSSRVRAAAASRSSASLVPSMSALAAASALRLRSSESGARSAACSSMRLNSGAFDVSNC